MNIYKTRSKSKLTKKISKTSKVNWAVNLWHPNFEKDVIAQIRINSLKEDEIYDLGFSGKKGGLTKKQISTGVFRDEIISDYLEWLDRNQIKSGVICITSSYHN